MQHLRANTQVIVTVGPFVDVGDGFTPQTDITLGGDEAELIKHGSTSVVDISGATWVAVTNCRGYYSLTLTTAYTNTEGMLVVIVQDDSDTLPVKQEYMVLSEAAWDSLYVAKDDGFMDVNIKTVGRADAQETEADGLESACSNYSATRGLTGTAVPAVAADGVGGLPISDAGGLDLDALNTAAIRLTAARAQVLDDWINDGRLDLIIDAILADTNELQADDIPASIAALPTAAENRAEMDSNSTRLAAIETDTTEIGTAGAGLTVLATAANLATAQTDLDTLTGSDGALIATGQTATAWSALEASAGVIYERTVDTVTNGHTPTTTEFQADDETEATADHYIGRVVIFTSGALAGQATDITDYAAVGGIGQFTVTALTEAPANDDTFVIV